MKKILIIYPLLFVVLLLSSCGKKETPRTLVEIEGPQNLTCEIAGRKLNRLKFLIIPGNYTIGFEAPGFRSEYRHVTVPAGQKKFTYKCDLTPVQSSVLIRSTPSGANVTMQGKSMGLTPLVIRDLEAGEYSAELSMRGYASAPVSWKIDSERPVAVTGNLDSNQGILVISSAPSRARVIIDGNEVGETPFTLERPEGKYVIRLERSGCNPEERNVRIARKAKRRLHIKLGEKPGAIQVTSLPDGAELFINGAKRGVTPCTVEALEPGDYTLKLIRKGFDPVEKSIRILAGVTEKMHYPLSKSTGSVVFNVRPVGVEVSLNGKSLGVARPAVPGSEATVDFRADNLEPGVYTVTMFHSLGDPPRQSFSFRVRKNQHVTLKSRVMWIADCEIAYGDGSRERGFLIDSKPGYVTFSPEPGVQFRVDRTKIKELIMLKGVKK
ncbi:MAG: PEGA domain-containing protein [Lentisphaeria bacterium]|nr:PEGA domain-containing protein [Lentisphaeria bacterium]